MKNYRNIGLGAALIAVMSFAGCTAQSGGTVKIVSISPEPYTTIRVGDKVDLKVEVEYTLEKQDAVVALTVQKEDSSSLGTAEEKIKKGSGRITLRSTFTGPETRIVTAFVPMRLQGYNKTQIVDSRTYNIAPKK